MNKMRCGASTVLHSAIVGLRLRTKGSGRGRRAQTKQIRAIRTQDSETTASRDGDEGPVAPSLKSDAREIQKFAQESNEESLTSRAFRSAYKRILLELSSLPRAMAVMFGIATLSSLGTVIEQGRDVQFYVENYPDAEQKLDHLYTAPYFYCLMALLVAQLVACTYTRQWPIAKAAKRWRFPKTTSGIALKENAQVLPDANIRDLGVILSNKGYEVFLKNGSLYGFKSLVARLAPIGVHAALLITIAGITWGVLGGFKGSVMIPEGRDIVVEQYMRPNTFLAIPPSGAYRTLRVDKFDIDYRSDGSISQFYSDLSVLNSKGQPTSQKQISVNDPLRFEGITMYQTDWGMSAMRVTVESEALPDGKQSARFPMAVLNNQQSGNEKVFATFIPAPGGSSSPSAPQGVSILAKDFQTVVLYDSKGQFAGVRRPGSGKSIEIEGMKITVDEITGSTGLEIKYDPGVPLVYTGFAGLMITTILSYLSHAQIWALQSGRDLHVAGKSSRAGVLFKNEFSEILDLVPDSGLN